MKAGEKIGENATKIRHGNMRKVEVIEKVSDSLILNTVQQDECQSREQALLKLYLRLRPGNPTNIKKANSFFEEKFFDKNRYRIGKVGRFRINRKLKAKTEKKHMTITCDDFIKAIQYIGMLRNNQGQIDDIDHLGNRRLRNIDEMIGDECRKGLLRMRKTVQERMCMKGYGDKVIRIVDLVNSKSR